MLHNATVVTTRFWFWKKYWVRCWSCSYKSGPYSSNEIAQIMRKIIEGNFEDRISELHTVCKFK